MIKEILEGLRDKSYTEGGYALISEEDVEQAYLLITGIKTPNEEKSNAPNDAAPLEDQTRIDEAKKTILVNELLCDECNMRVMGSMVGHGFTDYTCKNCNEIISYSNTGTPKMCKPCALELTKCQRCLRNVVTVYL